MAAPEEEAGWREEDPLVEQVGSFLQEEKSHFVYIRIRKKIRKVLPRRKVRANRGKRGRGKEALQ